MAANDSRGRQVLEVCRAYNLRVPEEVAVIGVDNDELLCQLSSPLLTSIEQGAKQIGFNAAALLEKLIHGKGPRQRRFLADPVGIVTRQSTDILAVKEPTVAGAVAFIQENACRGIKVRDVVNAMSISRSGLEAHFRVALGFTIHNAIRRVQLERARRLLSETNLPLKQAAANSGFRSVQHMTTLFGSAFGQTPAKYRHAITF
jgi:LacI family transcriptional regulator